MFGSFRAASFCGALDSRRNRVVFWCCMVVIPLASGWIYATWDADFIRMIYPLIIHLPLILLMSALTKKPWWSAVSVLTAYLCCQLRRWLALFVVALASGGHVMQDMVELVVTAACPAAAVCRAVHPEAGGSLHQTEAGIRRDPNGVLCV